MKTNHRRKNKKRSFDYAHLNFQRRWNRGLSFDHDGGHRGSAKDVREHKTIVQRRERRQNNNIEISE